VVREDDQAYHRLSDLAERERYATATAFAVGQRGLAWAHELDPGVPVRLLLAHLGSEELAGVLAGAGLLVLGGHGQGGQRAMSVGSTSAQLVHGLQAPILVPASGTGVLPAAEAPRRVVAAVALQPGEELVVREAAEQAEAHGCELIVVHVVRPGHDAAATEALEPRLRSVLDRGHRTRDAEVILTAGDPAEAILAMCRPADLLVVGSRGGGRMAGLVTGSLSRRLLDVAPCDVVVVPLAGMAGPVFEQPVDGAVDYLRA
jgi:nucleotide-binding universal stress UspA family protein